MKYVKTKIISLAALALAFLVSLGAFIAIRAAKADRAVSVGGSNVFSVAGGAEIWAHAVEHKIAGEEGEEDDPYYFTMFAFGEDGDAVNYRRNLAYKWFYDANDYDDYRSNPRKGNNGNWWIRNEDTKIAYSEDAETKVGEKGTWEIGGQDTGIPGTLYPKKAAGYLHLEVGFEEINFEKFVITFETQQYTMTEDGKTSNRIIFLPRENGGQTGLVAVVTDDNDQAEKKAADLMPEDGVVLEADHIVIELSGGQSGEYGVKIYNKAADPEEKVPEEKIQNGTFKNVGKTYAKNVSSSTDPVIPLSFKADLPEAAEGATSKARMVLYELNGQSFVLNRDSDGDTDKNFAPVRTVDDGDGKMHYEGGQLNDLTPPVICPDNDVRYITEGSELGSFTAIDVLRQSAGEVETGYFILTSEQAANADFNPDDPSDTPGLFRKVKASDDQYMIPHANHYVPKAGENYSADSFGEDFPASAAIKIYLKLTDTTATGGQSIYVMLDWYVADEYKITVNGKNYLAVAQDKKGASYNTEADWGQYQKEVDKAAENLRAGADDFYLPSFENLVKDNATSYTDMTYSVYYMVNGTRSSATGKTSGNLSLSLDNDGDYKFTVYAQDSASNKMWYAKKTDGGKPEIVEFEASEIWDIYDDEDLRNYLPWFTFTAGVSEITVEEPEEQDTAYVGATYTAGGFEIKGISTKESYSLYLFNNEAYAADHNGEVLGYDGFMSGKKELFEGEGRKYFTEITETSSLEEGTEEYERFNKYNWTAASRSFVPQDANSFYLIKCEVASTRFPTMAPVKAYMGIAASVTPDALEGENTWMRDNMASIILLCIAGAAFIGIILLLVIKPKPKTDVDLQLEEEGTEKVAKTPKNKK